MRRITSIVTTACVGLLLVSGIGAAVAQDTQHLTFVTFSGPVSLPGVTLPAGSYAFKLFDSQVNRNIVQIFDRDQTKIFATIIAIPAQRSRPADETVITFRESPANTAPAVRYWFYPGETTGQEFAYPKAQAMQIANAARESVVSIDAESGDAEAMKSASIGRVEPGAAAPTQQPAQPSEPAAAPTPTAQPETPAPAAAPPANREMQSSPAPAAAPQPQGTSGRGERPLPQTGSELPLVGLAGLLALAGAGSVRMVRRIRA